jgi:hypothetical protein
MDRIIKKILDRATEQLVSCIVVASNLFDKLKGKKKTKNKDKDPDQCNCGFCFPFD